MDDLNLKSKLKAIFNIINEMDDIELKDMASSEEEDPKKITMVSIKAKPIEEENMMEEEPSEDEMENVAKGEAPETEEEEDPNSALGRLRKRLQGAM